MAFVPLSVRLKQAAEKTAQNAPQTTTQATKPAPTQTPTPSLKPHTIGDFPDLADLLKSVPAKEPKPRAPKAAAPVKYADDLPSWATEKETYRPVTYVALVTEQICNCCNNAHYHFAGYFVRSQGKRDQRAFKLVPAGKPTVDNKLPLTMERSTTYTDTCVDCLETAGFFWAD